MIEEDAEGDLNDEDDWADALADGFMQFEVMDGVTALRIDGYGPYYPEEEDEEGEGEGVSPTTMYTALVEVGCSWSGWWTQLGG